MSREEFEQILEIAFWRVISRLRQGQPEVSLLPLLRSEIAAEFAEFDLWRNGHIL